MCIIRCQLGREINFIQSMDKLLSKSTFIYFKRLACCTFHTIPLMSWLIPPLFNFPESPVEPRRNLPRAKLILDFHFLLNFASLLPMFIGNNDDDDGIFYFIKGRAAHRKIWNKWLSSECFAHLTACSCCKASEAQL